MRKVSLVLLMAVLMLALTSSAFAALNQFRGHWKNIDPNTRGVTTLNIDVRGNLVTIRAWGKCHPQDCDWGRVTAHAYAPNVSSNLQATARALSAIFRTGFSQTLMVIHPHSRLKRLQAEIMTHFTDNSGRTDYNAVYSFEKTTDPIPDEDCVSFNPNTTSLARIRGYWKIVDGNHWLFDFGKNKAEAKRALDVIKYYGMNQSCFVGRPDPSFQYMLVSGRGPTGRMPGEDSVSFNPNTTTVRNISGRWKIVDGNHWLFDFGKKESEAREALAIIKRHGFRYSCFVGRPGPSFQYMRK